MRTLVVTALTSLMLGLIGPVASATAVIGPTLRAQGGPPTVRPVAGEVVRPFDQPAHPFGPGHRGVDLSAAPGARVRAARTGRVTFAGTVAGVGWVTIDHGGGLDTTYGDVRPGVVLGEQVAAGQVIAVLADSATYLDWGARFTAPGTTGRMIYLDPLLLLADLQPTLVAPAATGPATPG